MNRRTSLLLLLVGAVCTAPVDAAFADCVDKPISCDFGAFGRQGQCYQFPSCRDCGPRHCPSYPRSYTKLPKQISLSTCPKATTRATDGCSAPVSDPASNTYKTLFRAACDEHDICYSVLSSGKGRCDSDFRKNMESICREYYTGVLNSTQLGVCLAAAGTSYGAVVGGGQSAYENDQTWARSNCQ